MMTGINHAVLRSDREQGINTCLAWGMTILAACLFLFLTVSAASAAIVCSDCHHSGPHGDCDFTVCVNCHTKTINHPVGVGTPGPISSSDTCKVCHTTQHVSPINVEDACGQCHYDPAKVGSGSVFDNCKLSVYATNMHNTIPRTADFTYALGAESNQDDFTVTSACASAPCTNSYNFGDCSTGPGPSHTYANAGTYLVVLTVTDSTGSKTFATAHTVQAVSTNTAPIASKTTPVVTGALVIFNDTSTDAQDAPGTMDVTVYCGDGKAPLAQKEDTLFTCAYTTSGTYTITHSVKDSGGMISSSAPVAVTVTVPIYTVSGNLKKQAGTAITYATLKLQLAGVDVKSATTNSLGNFTFTGVNPGSYTVRIIKTGITQTPASVTPAINVVAGNLTGVAVKSVQ